MQTPSKSPSWEPASLPSDVDERSTVSRPSPIKRLIRRMGLSSTDAQDLPRLPSSYTSHSSGSLARSLASTNPSTFTADERSRPSRGVKEELPDVADMLEDDNMAWGATKQKPRRHTKTSRAHAGGL